MDSKGESSETGHRRKVETRIWLQILSLESTIFGRLNSALSAQHGLSVAKFEFLAQVDRYPEGITLGKPFPLPAAVKALIIARGTATVVQ